MPTTLSQRRISKTRRKDRGKLVQFLFRNPHSFVQVESEDDKGQVIRWAVEWGAGGSWDARA